MSESAAFKVEDDDVLELTAGRVRSAAESGCSDVKGALRALFPEVFERNDTLNIKWEGGAARDGHVLDMDDDTIMLSVRGRGDLVNRAFQLSDVYDWKIVTDNTGYQVLVPTRREETD